MTHRLSRRIVEVLDLAPQSRAVEFEGDWSTWAEVSGHARRVADLVARYGGQHAQVGVLLRNTPTHVATFLGLMLAEATLVVINPSRGDDRTRADIEALGLPIVIGTPDDTAALVTPSDGTTIVTV